MPSLVLLLCDSVLFGAGGTYPVSWETLIHLIPILQTSPSCPSSLPWTPCVLALSKKLLVQRAQCYLPSGWQSRAL